MFFEMFKFLENKIIIERKNIFRLCKNKILNFRSLNLLNVYLFFYELYFF